MGSGPSSVGPKGEIRRLRQKWNPKRRNSKIPPEVEFRDCTRGGILRLHQKRNPKIAQRRNPKIAP